MIQLPAADDPLCRVCLDLDVVCSTDYIGRFENSLVVDAVKRRKLSLTEQKLAKSIAVPSFQVVFDLLTESIR